MKSFIPLITFIFLLGTNSHTAVIRVPADVDSIQGGINLANVGDTVLVGPGIYQESINFLGKDIVVLSEMGMDSTVIHGDYSKRVIIFESGENPGAMIIGFTIENGNGGILCRNFSNPTIWRCKIRNNDAYDIYGFFDGGGGIASHQSSPMILNSIIYDNSTVGFGGGILTEKSSLMLINCVIYNNQANIPNSGGIFFDPFGGHPYFFNSIIWQNDILGPYPNFPFDEYFYYCDVEGGLIGTGNLNVLPQFIDPNLGDFHLESTSLCVNAGHPMAFFNDPDGSRNDMGAYGGSGFAFEALYINMREIPLQSLFTYSYYIYNLRNQPLTITGLNFSNSNIFYSPLNLPTDIPEYSIFKIPITFEPIVIGTDSSRLTIHLTDAEDSDSIQVQLKGEGISPYGNEAYRRQGILDAGLVRTLFINWGEIGHWPDSPSGEWPKGTGHQYLSGTAFIIQAETQDTAGNIIHPMETQYREFVDIGPQGELWGFLPVPGYFNPVITIPAISTMQGSWPTQWPNRPVEWGGYWNGFFGRGTTIADQESYFVFDDSQDREWAFYPVASDTSRRGLGLVVEGRSYAWADPLSEDLLVWQYIIKNISDFNYQRVVLGLYVDPAVGGMDDQSDDAGDYLPDHKMVYFWDSDGIGTPGPWSPVGMLAVKYLEMPGNPYDGIDNDDDGMIDESRDNDIDDDGDWNPLTDDVGMDGVPGTGDFGEGDGMPTAGEPNFDKTDFEESDDITINTVKFFPVHTYELWNEEENWQIFTSGVIDPGSMVTAGLGSFIISQEFPLQSGESTYFSFAIIFGDNLNDLLTNAGNIPLKVKKFDSTFNLPHTFQLFQNYPNPFNPTTTIAFDLPKTSNVLLKIFNILGEEVTTLVSARLFTGSYTYKWDATNLASGVYLYRLEAGDYIETKKMILMK